MQKTGNSLGCHFQKVYLFALPLITSLFTVVFQTSWLLQITYQNKDVSFFPHITRETLGSKLFSSQSLQSQTVSLNQRHPACVYRMKTFLWFLQVDIQTHTHTITHTHNHTYTHSSLVGQYIGCQQLGLITDW